MTASKILNEEEAAARAGYALCSWFDWGEFEVFVEQKYHIKSPLDCDRRRKAYEKIYKVNWIKQHELYVKNPPRTDSWELSQALNSQGLHVHLDSNPQAGSAPIEVHIQGAYLGDAGEYLFGFCDDIVVIQQGSRLASLNEFAIIGGYNHIYIDGRQEARSVLALKCKPHSDLSRKEKSGYRALLEGANRHLGWMLAHLIYYEKAAITSNHKKVWESKLAYLWFRKVRPLILQTSGGN